MTATGQMRGHPVAWDGESWRYADGEPANGQRPCVLCSAPPTPEGYDACIGHVLGVTSACCGHGVEDPYRVPPAYPRPADFERLSPAEFEAYIERTGFAATLRAADADPLTVWPAETVTERADRYAWVVVAGIVFGLAWWWLHR